MEDNIKWNLGKQVLRLERFWNWNRSVSSGRFQYQQCWSQLLPLREIVGYSVNLMIILMWQNIWSTVY